MVCSCLGAVVVVVVVEFNSILDPPRLLHSSSICPAAIYICLVCQLWSYLLVFIILLLLVVFLKLLHQCRLAPLNLNLFAAINLSSGRPVDGLKGLPALLLRPTG